MKPLHSLLLPLLALTFTACVSDSQTRTNEAPPAAPQVGADAKLNKVFLDKNLDVAQFTERFEGESREVYAKRTEIADALNLKPGMAIADIGSGTGLFLKHFAERVGEDGLVYAVEISPVFVKHLRGRAEKEGLPQVQAMLCGQRSADLPDRSVDVAFICDTYHHFEYPADTLASLFSAIRPGGQLVVVDFERIPGKTRQWLLDHVRAGKEVFRAEIEAAGFELIEEVDVGLEENYFLRFRRP